MKTTRRAAVFLLFLLTAADGIPPASAADLVGFGLEPVSLDYRPRRAPRQPKSLGGLDVSWSDGRLVFAFTRQTFSPFGSGGGAFSYDTQVWSGRRIEPLVRSDFQLRRISTSGRAAAGFSQDTVQNPFAARVLVSTFPPQSFLQQLAAPTSFAEDVSEDGIVTVGSSQNQPMRWSTANGTQTLPLPVGAVGGNAVATNSDGSVVVGRTYGVTGGAFLWTSANGTTPFAPLGADSVQPTSLSADGAVVIGTGPNVLPYRWTTDGNSTLLSSRQALPLAVSGNGSVIVGGFFDLAAAFIWDAATGARNLDQVLIANKVVLRGWKLVRAEAISTDGTVIAGRGTYLGEEASWVVRLDGKLPQPPPFLIVSGLRNRYPAATSSARFAVAAENATTIIVRGPAFSRTFRVTRGNRSTVTVPFPAGARKMEVAVFARGTGGTTNTRIDLRR